MLAAKVAVVTGGPGVGKTSTLDALLRILRRAEARVLLAAPTGRAAKRMSEQTGREARTLHRLLEVDPAHGGFLRDAGNPLDCDLLVVDEASMVDVPLMNALTRALPRHAALWLVGDVDSCPRSGRAGARRRDRVRSGRGRAPDGGLPAGRREPDRRQRPPDQCRADARGRHRPRRRLLRRGDRRPEIGAEKLVEIVARRIPRRFGLDPVRDVQVLCPMNRGALGARNLNHACNGCSTPTRRWRSSGSAGASPPATG